MNTNENSPNASSDQIASELSDGLKSCRAVVADYRAKLSGNPTAANSNDKDEEAGRLTSE